MGFNLDDYEPVSVRLARWLNDCEGQPRVLTHLVHFTDDWAIFRAELWVGDVLISTGWAEERKDSNQVTRSSWLETAETSALGRALANAGLAGSDPTKRASREEMGKVARAGGGGGGTPASGSGSYNGPRLANDKQKGAIKSMGAKRGHHTIEQLEAALEELFGRNPVVLDLLTWQEVDAVFKAWGNK